MNRILNVKSLLAATVACGALAAASAAHARTDVYLSLGVPAAPVYVAPQRLDDDRPDTLDTWLNGQLAGLPPSYGLATAVLPQLSAYAASHRCTCSPVGHSG